MVRSFNFRSKKGVLIAFEGISGCGKSSCIEEIYEYLSQMECKCVIFEWNSNQRLRKIATILQSRRLLTSRIYSILIWIGFVIDYIFKIIPLMNAGYVVIADRYIYTGLTRDTVNNAGMLLGNMIFHFVRKPDVLFFFDTSPQLCYERVSKRGKALFHTNKKILRSKALKNKDLYYLKKIHYEYIRLLKSKKVEKGTNLFFIESNDVSVCKVVQMLIDVKINKGSSPVWSFYQDADSAEIKRKVI